MKLDTFIHNYIGLCEKQSSIIGILEHKFIKTNYSMLKIFNFFNFFLQKKHNCVLTQNF